MDYLRFRKIMYYYTNKVDELVEFKPIITRLAVRSRSFLSGMVFDNNSIEVSNLLSANNKVMPIDFITFNKISALNNVYSNEQLNRFVFVRKRVIKKNIYFTSVNYRIKVFQIRPSEIKENLGVQNKSIRIKVFQIRPSEIKANLGVQNKSIRIKVKYSNFEEVMMNLITIIKTSKQRLVEVNIDTIYLTPLISIKNHKIIPIKSKENIIIKPLLLEETRRNVFRKNNVSLSTVCNFSCQHYFNRFRKFNDVFINTFDDYIDSNFSELLLL